MKLRNKKTGEVIETCKIIQNAFGTIVMLTLAEDEMYPYEFHSLAELNEDWEDYKPAEPLIKDEKVRKAVRAWADANSINSNHYYETDVSFDSVEHCFTWIDTSIQFNENTGLENLEHGKKYTIDELCGEEQQ